MVRSEEFRNAAISILQGSRTPLHFERIADRAIAKRILLSNADTLAAYMGAVLEYDVGRYKDQSAFVQTSQDHYGLNQKLSQIMPAIGEDKRMPVTAKFRSAAIRVLRGSIGPLHFEHISSKAISEGMIRPNTHTIAALMGEVLHEDIFQHPSGSPFDKDKMGYYRLKPNSPEAKMPHSAQQQRKSTTRANLPHSPKTAPHTQSTFDFQSLAAKPIPSESRMLTFKNENAGKAGEYMVTSKLLFLNCRVSIPVVDMGVDLIVTDSDQTNHYVQVKTSTTTNNIHRFSIKHSSFISYSKENMFYVFVLRHCSEAKVYESFLILPHRILESTQYSKYKWSGGKYINFTFYRTDDKFFLGDKQNDVTYALNNWELLSSPYGFVPLE